MKKKNWKVHVADIPDSLVLLSKNKTLLSNEFSKYIRVDVHLWAS